MFKFGEVHLWRCRFPWKYFALELPNVNNGAKQFDVASLANSNVVTWLKAWLLIGWCEKTNTGFTWPRRIQRLMRLTDWHKLTLCGRQFRPSSAANWLLPVAALDSSFYPDCKSVPRYRYMIAAQSVTVWPIALIYDNIGKLWNDLRTQYGRCWPTWNTHCHFRWRECR